MGNADLSEATLQMLVDRMLIEDLFTKYYADLDGSDSEAFGKYFVEGAQFDVNGVVVHGQREIADLYARVKADKPPLEGKFRMLLTNGQIVVTGETATAKFFWTQILNDSISGPPRLIEQGREFDRLVKQDGAWRIAKRVVIADSGLPSLFDETYSPREDYDLLTNP